MAFDNIFGSNSYSFGKSPKTLSIACLFFFIFLGSVTAQNNSFQPQREFGFNATTLISNLIPVDNSTSINLNDNLLFYKSKLGNGYFRTALNLNVNSESSPFDFTDAFFFLKLGYEKKRPISKSWFFHSGIEGFGGANSINSSARADRVEVGIGGIYGVQWMINNRIGLGTEGYLTFSFVDEKSPGPDSQSWVGGFILPRSLLLSIYF